MSKAEKTVRIQIVASEEWVKDLDEWRRKHPDLPNRSQAIRMLVAEGFMAWPPQGSDRRPMKD